MAILEGLEDLGTARPGVRRVEVVRHVGRLTELALSLGMDPPPGPVEREDAFEATMGWGVKVVRRL